MCLECLQKLDMARLVKRIVDFTVEEGMAGWVCCSMCISRFVCLTNHVSIEAFREICFCRHKFMITEWVTVLIFLRAHGCYMLVRTAPLTCLECLQKLDWAHLAKRSSCCRLHRGRGHGRVCVLLDACFPSCLSD
jgi:hypothetical protein